MKTAAYWLIYTSAKTPHSGTFDRFLESTTLDFSPGRNLSNGDILFVGSLKPRRRIVGMGRISNVKHGVFENGFHKPLLTTFCFKPYQSRISLSLDELCANPAFGGEFLRKRSCKEMHWLTASQARAILHLLNVHNPTARIPLAVPVVHQGDVDASSPHEGKRSWKRHQEIERSKKVVSAKIRAVLHKTGRLVCEVCGFDFSKVYKLPKTHFCEVHHLQPLSKRGREKATDLADLSVICSNCHRAIHLISPLPTLDVFRKRYLKRPRPKRS
jgi:hypothetical protein